VQATIANNVHQINLNSRKLRISALLLRGQLRTHQPVQLCKLHMEGHSCPHKIPRLFEVAQAPQHYQHKYYKWKADHPRTQYSVNTWYVCRHTWLASCRSARYSHASNRLHAALHAQFCTYCLACR